MNESFSEEVVVSLVPNPEKTLQAVWERVSTSDAPMHHAKGMVQDAVSMWIRRSVAKKQGFVRFPEIERLSPESERDIERISNAMKELVDDHVAGKLPLRTFVTACRVHALRDWGVTLL